MEGGRSFSVCPILSGVQVIANSVTTCYSQPSRRYLLEESKVERFLSDFNNLYKRL